MTRRGAAGSPGRVSAGRPFRNAAEAWRRHSNGRAADAGGAVSAPPVGWGAQRAGTTASKRRQASRTIAWYRAAGRQALRYTASHAVATVTAC